MNQEVRQVIAALDQFVEEVVQRVTLEATANLIEDTPVDTGWARSNWVPSIGAPFEEIAGSRDQAEVGNLNTAPQQQGIATVATGYRLPQGNVFISNNVPYIVNLNEGSSQQAPAAFVQTAIARGIREAIERLSQ